MYQNISFFVLILNYIAIFGMWQKKFLTKAGYFDYWDKHFEQALRVILLMRISPKQKNYANPNIIL